MACKAEGEKTATFIKHQTFMNKHLGSQHARIAEVFQEGNPEERQINLPDTLQCLIIQKFTLPTTSNYAVAQRNDDNCP